jgi:hypothetical protein
MVLNQQEIDVPYGDINLQELILQAHTSVVFKG